METKERILKLLRKAMPDYGEQIPDDVDEVLAAVMLEDLMCAAFIGGLLTEQEFREAKHATVLVAYRDPIAYADKLILKLRVAQQARLDAMIDATLDAPPDDDTKLAG